VGCAVITVSDTRRGRQDTAGTLIERLLASAGHRVAVRAWVRDEPAALRRAVRAALGSAAVDVVIVTGGTGLGPRDRTPETLARLAECPLPGFGELFRVVSVSQVGPAAWLSRAGAFVARGRLVVLLPGSRAAVELALKELLLPEIVHAVRMLGRFPTMEE
jgi:molybdenum cofactor biosynthesis protein B